MFPQSASSSLSFPFIFSLSSLPLFPSLFSFLVRLKWRGFRVIIVHIHMPSYKSFPFFLVSFRLLYSSSFISPSSRVKPYILFAEEVHSLLPLYNKPATQIDMYVHILLSSSLYILKHTRNMNVYLTACLPLAVIIIPVGHAATYVKWFILWSYQQQETPYHSITDYNVASYGIITFH